MVNPQRSDKTLNSLSFKSLMITQFLGAFNDNLYKLIVSLMIVSAAAAGEGSDGLSLGSLLFTLPFILFSPYAGPLCDKYSKTFIIRIAKVIECLVMVLACYFFATENITALLTLLFLLGAHSTLFSPAKYGSLPELLEPHQLPRGNGYIEFWTFLAILGGSALAGPVAGFRHFNPILPGAICFAIAAIGLITALKMKPLPAQSPNLKINLNQFSDTWSILREIKGNRPLFLSLVAIVYFWLVGVLIHLDILLYGKEMLGATETETSYFIAILALGIGIGSIVAGRVAEGRVELGLIPLGSLGIAISSVLLGFSYDSWLITGILFFIVGLSAGVFTVPVHSFFQHHSPSDRCGRYLAANNFVSYIGMMLASGCLWILTNVFNLSPAQIFVVIGASAFGITLYIFTVLPESLLRCLNWMMVHTIYRMKVLGAHNIPEKGGALILCNHLSYVDALLIMAAVPRPIRFVMYKPIYDTWPIRPLAKLMKTIPIQPGNRSAVNESIEMVRDLIKNGELVCIFPEGAISRHGGLLQFKRGFEAMSEELDAPIIPAHLDQVWGSIFSNSSGKFVFKIPKQIPYPVTVSFGAALPPSTKAFKARLAVQELGAESFHHRAVRSRVLHLNFLYQARSNHFRTAVTDSFGQTFSYTTLAGTALALARRIKGRIKEDKVGILLPPSSAAILANLAILFAGKVPVNLNYTAGQSSTLSAINQCGIKNVITTKKFIDKTNCDYVPGQLELSELIKGNFKFSVVLYSLLSLIIPPKTLFKSVTGHNPDDSRLGTIIFSSGSTAEPKGIMLTHANISSNIEALYDFLQTDKQDCLLGVLPFFHSFGFTGTLWLPLLAGIKAIYHYNPLDSGQIGNLVEKHRASILLGTPSFLHLYIKRCSQKQFSSLKLAVVGAEKLSESLASAFHEKFGIRPLEGYGCTELSPVAIISIPNLTAGKQEFVGNKPGKTGLPLPGVAAKITDPETGAELDADQSGMLLIKGPNIMKGYLNNPEKISEVIRDGWYITGDIANIDRDGFIEITDRLSRFSKIGGEMIPHIKIEEALAAALDKTEQHCVVTSVADAKRGERLIVLHTIDLDPVVITKTLSDQGLPNLWIPKKDDFFRVDAFPMLGSGKFDLKGIREAAKKLVEELKSRTAN